MRLRWTAVAGALLLVAACRAGEPAADLGGQPGQEAAARLPTVELIAETASGRHPFIVEVARSPGEQARGLMFRDHLAPDRGMLFPFDPPSPASFWMKNTLIPLDMIFIRADGTVARIAENTVPQSLESVESGEPVSAVLEIAGGRARQIGLRPDDRISWPR